jgi:hypothetical protein
LGNKRCGDAAEGLQNRACLASVAASQFRHNGIAGQPICDFMGAPLQHALVGARKAIFRQEADDFKQLRAYLVIEIFRSQFLLPGLGQTVANVARKGTTVHRDQMLC